MFSRRTTVAARCLTPALSSLGRRPNLAISAARASLSTQRLYEHRVINPAPRRRNKGSLRDIVNDLAAAIRKTNFSVMTKLGHDLQDRLKTDDEKDGLSPKDRAKLADALVLITPLTWMKIEDIYGVLPPGARFEQRMHRALFYQLEPYCAEELRSRLLDAVAKCLDRRDRRLAMKWLTHYPVDQYGAQDTALLWHQLLDMNAEDRMQGNITLCLHCMKTQGMDLLEASKVVFAALFRRSAAPAHELVTQLIHQMKEDGLPFDVDLLQTIITGYMNAGEPDLAAQAKTLYIMLFAVDGSVTHEEMNEALAHRAREEGEGAVEAFKTLRRRAGMVASQDTLLALLGDRFNQKDVKKLQRELQLKASPEVLRLLSQQPQYDEGSFDRYDKAKRLKRLTPLALEDCVGFLLSGDMHSPSQKAVDQALKIYDSYISRYNSRRLRFNAEHTLLETANSTVSDDPAAPEPSIALQAFGVYASPRRVILPPIPLRPPNVATYTLLLRALSLHSQNLDNIKAAISLIEDMRKYEIQLNSQQATSLIVMLMRASPTPEDAFRLYRLLSRSPDDDLKPALDEEGYSVVLNAFCRLATWRDNVPVPRYYFDIVRDMRKYGIPVTAKVYTILLSQIAHLATRASRSQSANESGTLQNLARTTRRVHDHLLIDTSFTPDTPLWNQLMDAYQRVGCFGEALSIWQQLFGNGGYNEASVSIIIDACAFAKAYEQAVRIFTSLMSVGFPLNLRNWNTFLECLCRLDKLDEALKVLCLEMTAREDGVAPDEESVRILLKFAMSANRVTEVRMRVKRFLPKLWASLPDDIKVGFP